MRHVVFLALCFCVVTYLPAQGTAPAVAVRVSPGDARLGYLGRYAMIGDEARLGFPGITIRFVYRGPAPTLQFGASSPYCAFNLSVNGWDPVAIRLPEGRSELRLPSGTAPESGWVVELVRRNEAWQGVASFFGLELPPGCEVLPAPPLPDRRLMFIGDSMTCGERVERMPPENDPTPRTANATRTFGMLLGRWLHAQVHLVSYGGKGLIRDWQGHDDAMTASQFFERALPDDPASRWDHSVYTPDAIVICLGQNDLNPGLLDEAVLTGAYVRFVQQVRAVHPQAALLLAESPMQDEQPGSAGRARRDARGATCCVVVSIRSWPSVGRREISGSPWRRCTSSPERTWSSIRWLFRRNRSRWNCLPPCGSSPAGEGERRARPAEAGRCS